MVSKQTKWSLVCNPAAGMHSHWQDFLPQWGVPENLAKPLWEHRHQTGALSRFVVERFQLNLNSLLGLEDSALALLSCEEKKLESKLIKVGALFFHLELVKIIDGDQLREIKQEWDEEHFSFLRFSVQKFITPPLAAFIEKAHPNEARPMGQAQALEIGLALLLQNLPQNLSKEADLRTFLCLKLPPFATAQKDAAPCLPAGFTQLQNKFARLYERKLSPTLSHALSLDGLWSTL